MIAKAQSESIIGVGLSLAILTDEQPQRCSIPKTMRVVSV
jgi:hypothetical protein